MERSADTSDPWQEFRRPLGYPKASAWLAFDRRILELDLLDEETKPETLEEALLTEGQLCLCERANGVVFAFELYLSCHLVVLGVGETIFRVAVGGMQFLRDKPGLFRPSL